MPRSIFKGIQAMETNEITKGRGVVILVEPKRAWLSTPAGARLFFPLLVWKSPGRPVVGDHVAFKQVGPDVKHAQKVTHA